jgi:hypothetical protein
MEGLRLLAPDGTTQLTPCHRCQAAGCPWDRISGKAICPDCQEQLILGEGAPLVERVEKRTCSICSKAGTLRYVTFPLRGPQAVEIDLCGCHVQALLGRRLDKFALKQLGRQLKAIGLKAEQLFLLHEAFYDEKGRALQPVPDLY